MARSTVESLQECDVTQPSEEKLDFDEDTLRAIAEVYFQDGNKQFRGKDFDNSIHFYTEGIKVNCKDNELKAKLYCNRATANLRLVNYQDTLNDANAAIELEPGFIKGIERGASACVELGLYEEAITWCDKGLAMYKDNKTLRSLRSRCIEEHHIQDEAKQKKVKHELESLAIKASNSGNYLLELIEHALEFCRGTEDKSAKGRMYGNVGNAYDSLRDFEKATYNHKLCLKIAKEVEDRTEEGRACGNLGSAYYNLGDFKKAIQYHELYLRISKEVRDRYGEGLAYASLGADHYGLFDFKKAIEYHECYLNISKEVGDKNAEGLACSVLGSDYFSLSDSRRPWSIMNDI